MAKRKVEDDVMARTAAERAIGDVMEATGVIDSSTNEPTEAGRLVLGELARAVQFEKATSKDPDGVVVPQRRIVITGPWEVDPDALKEQRAAGEQ